MCPSGVVTGPTPNPFINLVVQAATALGGDWFSNPWKTGTQMAVYTGNYELRKLQVSWARTPTVGVVQDADICTFHFLNITNGVPDATWTTADYTTVEGAFDTYWGAVKSKYAPEIKLSEYLWRADGPAHRPFGAALSPTLRITPKSVVGGGAAGNVLPPQCAMSVTEVTEASFLVSGVGVPGDEPGTGRTQRRNRWGRFYMPAMSSLVLNDGRFDSNACLDIANGVQAMYNACVAAQLVPVMYSPTTGSAFSILEVHVDDIVDVIRSRRYVTPLTRQPYPIDAA